MLWVLLSGNGILRIPLTASFDQSYPGLRHWILPAFLLMYPERLWNNGWMHFPILILGCRNRFVCIGSRKTQLMVTVVIYITTLKSSNLALFRRFPKHTIYWIFEWDENTPWPKPHLLYTTIIAYMHWNLPHKIMSSIKKRFQKPLLHIIQKLPLPSTSKNLSPFQSNVVCLKISSN